MIANDLPYCMPKQICQLQITRVTINYTLKGMERREKRDNDVSAGCESVLGWKRNSFQKPYFNASCSIRGLSSDYYPALPII